MMAADPEKATRDELDEQARKAGVSNPEALDTKADVVAAIEATKVLEEVRGKRNPALVYDDEVKPKRHKYRVVGEQPVHGVQPGGTFTATLPLQQEQFLLEGGAIARED